MPKGRLSKDQKRKQKLSQRAQAKPQANSLAISGGKFKTDELVPLWYAFETAIYQAFVMTEQRLLDSTVYTAVEEFIDEVENDTLLITADGPGEIEFDDVEIVVGYLRANLRQYEDDNGPVVKRKVVGVLRSILGTIELKRTRVPQSQAYVRYVINFLKTRLGIKVTKQRA